jgi:hypothetical protein
VADEEEEVSAPPHGDGTQEDYPDLDTLPSGLDESMNEGSEDSGGRPSNNRAVANFEAAAAQVRDSGRKIDRSSLVKPRGGDPLEFINEHSAELQQVGRKLAETSLCTGSMEQRSNAIETHAMVGAAAWHTMSLYLRHASSLRTKFVSFVQDQTKLLLSLSHMVHAAMHVGRNNMEDITALQEENNSLRESNMALQIKLGDLPALQADIKDDRERVRSLRRATEARFMALESKLQAAELPPRPPTSTHTPMDEDRGQLPLRPPIHWGPDKVPTPTADPNKDQQLEAAIEKLKATLPPLVLQNMTYGQIVESAQNMVKDWPLAEVSKPSSGGYRVPTPGKYSGEDPKVDVDDQMFIYHTYLTATDVPKARWATVAMQLLIGTAQTQYTTFARSISPATPTWEQFLQVMAQFAPPNKRYTAMQNIMHLKQTSTVQSYVQKFRTLLSQIGDPVPSKTEQVLYLWQGLSASAKLTSPTDSTGLFWVEPEALMTHACNIEMSANMVRGKDTLHTSVFPPRTLKAARVTTSPTTQVVRKSHKTSSGAGPSGTREEPQGQGGSGYQGDWSRQGRGKQPAHQGGSTRGSGSQGRGNRGQQKQTKPDVYPCPICVDHGNRQEKTHGLHGHEMFTRVWANLKPKS